MKLWPLALLVVLALGSSAYAGGGAVKGTVTTSDHAPVADGVVMIEGPALPTLQAAPHLVMEQRHETFVPHVLALSIGAAVDFPNHDPMLHNVFSASPAKKFDLGMYDQGETKSVTFDTAGVVRVGCNVHPKMEAFIVVHPNPYVAVTDRQGSYTITGVPAGSYQVRVWHERLGERQMPVVVRDGQVQPLDLQLAMPPR
jgi:plastocyanin